MNKNIITGKYNAIDTIAKPNPIIRNAENKYPINKIINVTLLRSNNLEYLYYYFHHIH